MTKDFTSLKTFEWNELLEEMKLQCPFILKLLITILIPQNLSEDQYLGRVAANIPRLGTAFGIFAQGRNSSLSKIQRIVSTILFDNMCDQKVFDGLQPLGVCLSYSGGLQLLDSYAGHFNRDVIDALLSGKRIRLVGDNINWKTNVNDERQDHHGKMHHAFGSAVIVQNTSFNHLPVIKPQIPTSQITPSVFIPTVEECDLLQRDFAETMVRTAARHIPYFESFLDILPINIWEPAPEDLHQKNTVISLPVLHHNEQKYDETVKILDYYEDFLKSCYEEAGIQMGTVHIGGDQLTRDWFSGAKRLRACGLDPYEKLQHLSPITFEMFHLMMNYCQLVFKQLFRDSSSTDVGTMKCEADRILRSNVNVNVNEHYNADRDFIVSFVDCYIVEAVLHYFGMEDSHSVPTKNKLPSSASKEDKRLWLIGAFSDIVRTYIWAKEEKSTVLKGQNVEVEGVIVPVKLSNGKCVELLMKRKRPETDMIKNYSHLVLDLGVQFKSLLSLFRSPNRQRGLALLKLTMIHFKANNGCSKYASEILRLLVHQHCILSEKEAAEEFYGMFVNTTGKPGSHIPCDLKMEHIVKEVKSNIKHMFSNKTDKNITTRTSALPLIKDISEKFDVTTGVIVRSKKHTHSDSLQDEKAIMNDIRQLKPFENIPGRKHLSFPSVPKQMDQLLDKDSFRAWLDSSKYKYANDLGN